jgi:hypothetical protein
MNNVWQRAAKRAGIRQILGAALLAALASCGGGGEDDASRASPQGGIGGSGRTSTNGTLAVALAATPSCGFDAINVTISELRFNENPAAGDGGAGWVDLPLPAPLKVNILTLTNGMTLPIGAFGTAGGTYTQMRLVLAPDDALHPLANSVVPAGGVETALSTPSAQQSGIKIDAAMTVPAGGIGSYLVDIDSCQSVTRNGAGQYVLNPVFQVVAAGASSAGAAGRR